MPDIKLAHIFSDFGNALNSQKEVHFSSRDLEAAEIQAHARGLEEGIEQGFAEGQLKAISEHQKEIEETIKHLESQLETMLNDANNIKGILVTDILELTKVIISKLIPSWMSRHSINELSFRIEDIINQAYNQKKIIIRLNNKVIEDIRKKLAHILSKHEEISLIAADHIDNYSCEISWDAGGAEFSLQSTADKIQDVISEFTSKHKEQEQNQTNIEEIENGE